ncbi:hypothetical protein CFC21_063643 [Triticum aestivum]|uniref:Tyrosinase copper-binding domain-containing protein n=2 Tax=Triticum aestivum TaxID=4565 RepID=A0A3B6JP55_WHEAT|nr:hypothetical protein CFC21_063643 [Triticum aestivum]
MACRGGCAPFAACVFLVCAVATAVYTGFPASMSPCGSTLARALLAVSGLHQYIIPTAPHALVSGDKKIGGPLATSLHTCGKPKLPPHALPPFYCCPPAPASEPINFSYRTRRSRSGSGGWCTRDPRSFYQLVNVHCAYCTSSYRQTANPELDMQIHYSWFFFPFHRAYLYFFERIAAKLLGEPDFALPFWSWDVPEGMRMPPEFANSSLPLYDPAQNPRHAPPRVVDLDFVDVESNLTDEQQIQHNLKAMYKQVYYLRSRMIGNAALPPLFHGQPFRAGQFNQPGGGSVELSAHDAVHAWTGDIGLPNVENMGTYYSAGRDPLFYLHHNNIDRLWQAWRDIGTARGYRGHVDFTDPDWLDSSFLFYDEEFHRVRITVQDVLDTKKLRYRFDGVGMPWADARPPTTPNVNGNTSSVKSVRFPVSVDDAAVSAEVRRSGVLRSSRELVLVLEGTKTNGTGMVKFDVYINAMEHEKVKSGGREMAGSYMCLSHPRMDGTGKGMRIETSMRVALNELLEDLGADGDKCVTVTLVPRRGKAKVGSLRIVYMEE